jgi:formamidopyrimidine-DNA glycosylase
LRYKHGLNQYKINHAKDYAKHIMEEVSKLELLFHLSQEGHIEEEKAENGIKNWLKDIENSTKELLRYLEPRKD